MVARAWLGANWRAARLFWSVGERSESGVEEYRSLTARSVMSSARHHFSVNSLADSATRRSAPFGRLAQLAPRGLGKSVGNTAICLDSNFFVAESALGC